MLFNKLENRSKVKSQVVQFHLPAHGEEEKADEVSVVLVADAVVDPGAVVIHLLHAPTALPAVVRPRHLEPLAHL